jgi:hypothetical protein
MQVTVSRERDVGGDSIAYAVLNDGQATPLIIHRYRSQDWQLCRERPMPPGASRSWVTTSIHKRLSEAKEAARQLLETTA